jgi:hypothetical protein
LNYADIATGGNFEIIEWCMGPYVLYELAKVGNAQALAHFEQNIGMRDNVIVGAFHGGHFELAVSLNRGSTNFNWELLHAFRIDNPALNWLLDHGCGVGLPVLHRFYYRSIEFVEHLFQRGVNADYARCVEQVEIAVVQTEWSEWVRKLPTRSDVREEGGIYSYFSKITEPI